MVSTVYSDGLGRSIQTKLKLGDDRDRISCTFYDEAGRPKYATKPFVDRVRVGEYLPGEITDTNVKDQLEASNDGDTRAFSETEYWDDPPGRVNVIVLFLIIPFAELTIIRFSPILPDQPNKTLR